MRLSGWMIYLAGFLASPCVAANNANAPVNPAGGILMVQAAPTAIHWHSSPDYTGNPWLVGAEWQLPSHWLGGYSYFKNSFDQPCHYLYAGHTWAISEKVPSLYLKVTGGVIVGYKEPYENKIPLNHDNVAPAIVPGIGYKWDRFNAQLNLFGTAGFMITVGYDLVR